MTFIYTREIRKKKLFIEFRAKCKNRIVDKVNNVASRRSIRKKERNEVIRKENHSVDKIDLQKCGKADKKAQAMTMQMNDALHRIDVKFLHLQPQESE